MPTPTYIPLATKTLTATATSVTFSSISQAYRDLVLVANIASTTDYVNVRFQFNGSTTAIYSNVWMYGTGTSEVSSSNTTSGIQVAYDMVRTTASARNSVILNVMDYSATDKHKSVLVRNGQTGTAGVGYGTSAIAGRFATTAAIVSMKIAPASGNFIVGSTFTLYGIASA